jgi:hypothetical protein
MDATKGEIIASAYFFTELYDEFARGAAPFLAVWLKAAEHFTDAGYSDAEMNAVTTIAARIFEGRAGGVSSALVH